MSLREITKDLHHEAETTVFANMIQSNGTASVKDFLPTCTIYQDSRPSTKTSQN